MKLRIKGNSIRLRLLRSEVARFAETGLVIEETSFGLTYTLERTEAPAISASFDRGRLRIFVPESIGRTWATTEQVGLLSDTSDLKILIEKDFQCLKPRTSGQWEDESDAFPNPNPTCGHTS